MKATHLITLSARIDELAQFSKQDKINGHEFINSILKYKDFLKQSVNIGQFVAAENGVLLEKPKGKNPKRSIWEPYNEAQKSVIFEGWEVSQNKKDDFFIYVFNKELDIEIEFDTNDGEIEILLEVSKRSFFAPEPIKSLADLAEATTKNPLKLK